MKGYYESGKTVKIVWKIPSVSNFFGLYVDPQFMLLKLISGNEIPCLVCLAAIRLPSDF